MMSTESLIDSSALTLPATVLMLGLAYAMCDRARHSAMCHSVHEDFPNLLLEAAHSTSAHLLVVPAILIFAYTVRQTGFQSVRWHLCLLVCAVVSMYSSIAVTQNQLLLHGEANKSCNSTAYGSTEVDAESMVFGMNSLAHWIVAGTGSRILSCSELYRDRCNIHPAVLGGKLWFREKIVGDQNEYHMLVCDIRLFYRIYLRECMSATSVASSWKMLLKMVGAVYLAAQSYMPMQSMPGCVTYVVNLMTDLSTMTGLSLLACFTSKSSFNATAVIMLSMMLPFASFLSGAYMGSVLWTEGMDTPLSTFDTNVHVDSGWILPWHLFWTRFAFSVIHACIIRTLTVLFVGNMFKAEADTGKPFLPAGSLLHCAICILLMENFGGPVGMLPFVDPVTMQIVDALWPDYMDHAVSDLADRYMNSKAVTAAITRQQQIMQAAGLAVSSALSFEGNEPTVSSCSKCAALPLQPVSTTTAAADPAATMQQQQVMTQAPDHCYPAAPLLLPLAASCGESVATAASTTTITSSSKRKRSLDVAEDGDHFPSRKSKRIVTNAAAALARGEKKQRLGRK